MQVKAGDLAEALKPAKPHALQKKPKPVPVALEQDYVTQALSVIEAKHGLFAKVIDATGDFPKSVHVDGTSLEKLASSWPPDTLLELAADAERLTILAGKSRVSIPRLDSGGTTPILRTPIPPNKKHKGKVVVPPDPASKRVALADTWGFSARVPMPQHHDQKDKT
ncbi:hypothetical protein LMG27198_43210 [Methylocystis echinoides]|uniref:Uncharacterized protein n=2 Tax=Methylocystis echinoides TaxID=29468 RepID=A0A9W6GYQ1_9HYPH|nr:hypothetical protein LMG27198_43210 [Methylocystis echinoides]